MIFLGKKLSVFGTDNSLFGGNVKGVCGYCPFEPDDSEECCKHSNECNRVIGKQNVFVDESKIEEELC